MGSGPIQDGCLLKANVIKQLVIIKQNFESIQILIRTDEKDSGFKFSSGLRRLLHLSRSIGISKKLIYKMFPCGLPTTRFVAPDKKLLLNRFKSGFVSH